VSGAVFIVAINLAVAGLIALGFLFIASHEKGREAGRWLAAAYFTGIVYSLVEIWIRATDGGPVLVALSTGSLLTSMAFIAIGLARHYRLQPPVFFATFVIVAGALLAFPADLLPRFSLERMSLFQSPFVAMQILSAYVVARAKGKRPLDWGLIALFVLSGAQFAAKPFIAFTVGGWGDNPGAYLQSNYAMISQSMGTVTAFAVAMMLMVLLGRGILAEATLKSEIDPLTAIYNRRGFEQRTAEALASTRRYRLPLSIVACDLDHFKSINDTYGHSAGDRVLSTFASFLKKASPANYAIGRLGGEEFAIAIPGANLTSARLFAEGLRAALSDMSVDVLPHDRRITASFGVAEIGKDESWESALLRADKAMYQAKHGGRDLVRTDSVDAALERIRRIEEGKGGRPGMAA
jgi:diguanylate cyclase (GGDEF)-like protein